MESPEITKLKIGDLEAKIPIIQGGMGVGISLSGLVSAVANEGGIGVIATVGIGMLEKDFYKDFLQAEERALRREIRKAKKLSKGIIGANIMVALTHFDRIVKTVVEEKVDIVFLSAGLPLKVPLTMKLKKLIETNIKVVPKVSSARAGNIIFKKWDEKFNYIPDGLVIEGPLSGGHQGFKKEQLNNPDYALENLLPPALEMVKFWENKYGKKIPIIVAGGIFTGKDIYKFLKMGASGVKMGTRFVATYECDADEKFKHANIKCKKEDIVIIDSPVGIPARVIKNKFIDDVNAGIKKPFKCPLRCLKTCKFPETPYCIAYALTNAKLGNLKNGFAFIGAKGYLIKEITTVKKLIKDLIIEYKAAADEYQNCLNKK